MGREARAERWHGALAPTPDPGQSHRPQHTGSGLFREPVAREPPPPMYPRALAAGLFLLGCWLRSGAEERDSLPKCRSCQDCSADNGCLSCQHRLFLLIRREGIRQHGECMHVCPGGHYSVRGKDANRCLRCKAVGCEDCFSREFCIRCRPDHYLLKGKCYTTCPKGSAPEARLMECVDGCEVGPWSEWGPCVRNQQTCGYKWGNETRTRQELSASINRSEPCVALTMSRRCRIRRRHCPGDKKTHRHRGNKWRKRQQASGQRSEDCDVSS